MKKVIFSALVLGLLFTTSCNSDDDNDGGDTQTCQTCEVDNAGTTVTTEYCDNEDGTATATVNGQEVTFDLAGLSFADYIAGLESTGFATCN